jgi:hypothetical protein
MKMKFTLKKELKMARKVLEEHRSERWQHRNWQLGDRFYYEKDGSQKDKGEVIVVDKEMLERLKGMQKMLGDSQCMPFTGEIIWLPSDLQYMEMTATNTYPPRWHVQLTIGRGGKVYIQKGHLVCSECGYERWEDGKSVSTLFADSPAEAWEKMIESRKKREV